MMLRYNLIHRVLFLKKNILTKKMSKLSFPGIYVSKFNNDEKEELQTLFKKLNNLNGRDLCII